MFWDALGSFWDPRTLPAVLHGVVLASGRLPSSCVGYLLYHWLQLFGFGKHRQRRLRKCCFAYDQLPVMYTALRKLPFDLWRMVKEGGGEGGRLLKRYRESHPFNALVSITVARWRAQKRPNWIEMTHVIWCAARGVHRRSLWWPSSKWSPEQVTSWRWSITWSFYLR